MTAGSAGRRPGGGGGSVKESLCRRATRDDVVHETAGNSDCPSSLAVAATCGEIPHQLFAGGEPSPIVEVPRRLEGCELRVALAGGPGSSSCER